MPDKIIDKCEVHCINRDQVELAQKQMISDDEALELAEIFKALSDTTRIKILHALMLQELCVCDIAATISLSESAVSHQLRLLRSKKIVKFRRDGKVLYYSLDDNHIENLLKQGLEHVNE